MLVFLKEEHDMMTKLKAILLCMGLCLLAFAYGCILSPDQGGGGDPTPPVVWKDLTHKDDVIENFVNAYNKADITHYQQLLHPDYTFYLQKADVTNGKEFFTRTEDVNIQTEMFKATRGQATNASLNADKLELSILSGSWLAVDSIGNQPCNDCWKTTREYTITLIFTGGQNGYTGNDQTEFIVVPVVEGGKTLYKLWRQTDINGG
jgi:hypothetical protein